MSNSVSTGINAGMSSKQEGTRSPQAQQAGPKQRAFHSGTMSMLEDARNMAENAAGQGMQLNPIIYQMLGLNPTMEDHSAELAQAQQELGDAQAQFDEANKAFDQLKGIPKKQRSHEQKKQFKQLKQQLKNGQKPLEDAQARFNQLQTMPNTITGFERMDPNDIDASSPFSALNPLNKAQATEAGRLNEYLAGGEVDPTLKHEYTAAEQALRAKLAERFGPDFENTTVGQMALQNFGRERNEAFATWNEQQVEKYNELAFNGAANLQTLLAKQIGLMREPAGTQSDFAAAISNLAGGRLAEESQNLAERSARQGLVTNVTGYNPATGMGALGGLASSPAMQKLANAGWEGVKSGGGALYDWATGAGAANAATATAAEQAAAAQAGSMMGANYGGMSAAASAAATDAAAAEGGGWLASLFCCHPDTEIEMADGTTKKIRDMFAGDRVMSIGVDGMRTPGRVAAAVSRYVGKAHQMLKYGNLIITAGHPLMDGESFGSVFGSDCAKTTSGAQGTEYTYDILVESPTGAYCAYGVMLGSTLDTRHRKAA